jgi:hypothetical protein
MFLNATCASGRSSDMKSFRSEMAQHIKVHFHTEVHRLFPLEKKPILPLSLCYGRL